MWHEARRQEKQLRARIVDGSKRAERRRRYFDNVRRDPDQFMQIHGNKSIIYAERSIARAAEDANILRSWVGDKDILIDRFDARSHLDCIESPEGAPQLSSMEKKEELVCNYERYRLLVMNEFKDISEKAVLKNISEKEFWLNGQTEDQRKLELEKKKRKTGDKKATIGFSYGDTVTVAGRNEQESESEEEMQTEELDADLEVYLLNPESQKRCNKIGENFGVSDQNFCALFKADQQAQRTASELKRIDRQKASLIGRDAKDDRRLLKQERASLIANARQDEAIVVFPSDRSKKENVVSESSSSSSDEEPAKAEFILSFGKDDEEPLNKSSSKRHKNGRNKRRSRSRSRDRRKRSSSGSRERYRRRRSHSRDRRSRSRERRRSRDRGKRSNDKKRSGRSRSRSTDRKRKRTRASSSSSRSPDRPLFKSTPVENPKFQEPLAEKKDSSDDNGPTSLLEIRSSMSESEKERIEIENRKRRIRKTKRMLKNKSESRRERTPEKDNSEHVQAVKKKMQKALKATVVEMKEEEEERKREAERERRVRDELIFIEQQERKMREQKKVEDLRRADLDRAIEDAKKRAEDQRRRGHSSDSDYGD